MNKVYRKVWNARRGVFVAVAETAKGQRKAACGAVGALIFGVLLAGGAQAQTVAANALPTGAQVTAGAAAISQAGNTLNINQSTQRAAINWQSFNVGSAATVNFNQPNSSAITLNRVVGNERSVIDGAIHANGNVWILNSAGVLFNASAQVDVGGLVASTLNISDADFMAGRTTFESTGPRGSIINLGTLTAADGGHIALLGNQVSNQGVISANLGSAMLAAGDKISLNFNGNSLVGVTIDRGTLDALVENRQAIYADGGRVVLTTQALDTVLNGLVNNTGLIRANGIGSGQNGEVILYAHGGTMDLGGTIQADGGSVETSGKVFAIEPGAVVQAANWLIDPVNITIDSTLAGTIATALGAGTVMIQTGGGNNPSTASGESGTDGDITINAPITWSANNTLWLYADRNIHINAPITATGAMASVALWYGQGAVAANNTATYDFGLGSSGFAGKINLQAGASFSTKFGNDTTPVTWTVLAPTAADLQSMSSSGNYVLGDDVSLSSISNWTPIGRGSMNFFAGSFDGLGHTIDQLTINSSANQLGFFWATSYPTIRNLGLTNVSINGTGNSSYVGALTGYDFGGSHISAVYSSGSVNAAGNSVGGLIGYTESAVLSQLWSSGSVTGNQLVGGLIGELGTGANLSNSYSSANVTGTGTNWSFIGGLVGEACNSSLSNVYATGSVTANGVGGYDIGGLTGYDSGATTTNAYATGNVTTDGYSAGGLVGEVLYGSYSGVFATGNVSSSFAFGPGWANVGGLIGYANTVQQLNDAYATGSVTGNSTVGGLLGYVNSVAGSISRTYATGLVTATAPPLGTIYVGGYAGYVAYGGSSTPYANLNAQNSYWNSTTTGQTNAWVWDTGAAASPSPSMVAAKSTADLQSLATYSSWASNIVADANLLVGNYPQLRWATGGASAGSSAWVIGAGMPNNGSNGGGNGGGSGGGSSANGATWSGLPQVQHDAVEQVRAASYEQSVVPLPVNPALVDQGHATEAPSLRGGTSNVVSAPPAIETALSSSNNLLVLTVPQAQEPTAAVSLSEARTMMGGSSSGGNGDGSGNGEREVRVPVSRDSLAEIVNGGVKLPNGVEQQLFVVKN